IGRWVQRDPIGVAGGINDYVYALNRPAFLLDPTGTENIPVLTVSVAVQQVLLVFAAQGFVLGATGLILDMLATPGSKLDQAGKMLRNIGVLYALPWGGLKLWSDALRILCLPGSL
ncbi:MAG: hypothetical protein HXY23_14695, partial [Parvularculaceae bacterium]|nr:hypothetical protein [Parvularculaceae bacterium]